MPLFLCVSNLTRRLGGVINVWFSDDISLRELDLRSLYLSIKEKVIAGQKCRQLFSVRSIKGK